MNTTSRTFIAVQDVATRFLMERGDEEQGDAYLGQICTEGGIEYLGCITCRDLIDESQGGMCRACREDLAYADQS